MGVPTTARNCPRKRFSDFPMTIKNFKKWINACKHINADGSPWNPVTRNIYLREDHFVAGTLLRDPSHPGYVPSIFKFKRLENPTKKETKKIFIILQAQKACCLKRDQKNHCSFARKLRERR